MARYCRCWATHSCGKFIGVCDCVRACGVFLGKGGWHGAKCVGSGGVAGGPGLGRRADQGGWVHWRMPLSLFLSLCVVRSGGPCPVVLRVGCTDYTKKSMHACVRVRGCSGGVVDAGMQTLRIRLPLVPLRDNTNA
jgi:hypothetical protein